MTYDSQLWTRFEVNGTPIYMRGDRPAWFVPNTAGDRLLQGGAGDIPEIERKRFFARLPDAPALDYLGRYEHLTTDRLRELWLHITNRCNLACRHCLFCSGPESHRELTSGQILSRTDEAYSLGCRIFALTGGEPLVHPNIPGILEGMLRHADAHVVILTNGLLLSRVLDANLDLSRVHFQISVDGLAARHDAVRGEGMFAALEKQLRKLKDRKQPFTLSMCVTRQTLEDMTPLVDYAADSGASNLHYLWYFVQGRGETDQFVPPDEIFPEFVRAVQQAQVRGIQIDNLEALKTQIFAPAGTLHDGSGSGWESVAVGPDDYLYPSAALVGQQELATPLNGSLADGWRNSDILKKVRQATIAGGSNPFRVFTGGGDLDHSWIHGAAFMGRDPYIPLYEKIMLWLIQREINCDDGQRKPALKLKMGELLESCGAHGRVALTHANCLLALADHNSRNIVKQFYSDAAQETKEDILNPICYAPEDIDHIPEEYRFRGYGCGSPVLDADIREGEVVVDLGSGRGIEIFISARLTGRQGRSIGVDMLDPMLEIAEQGATAVRNNLGYNNIEFRKGYLEQLPLEDNSVDLILSNCVMNLSTDKRRAFREIFRALKPGGRLVISDVVCEDEPDPEIRNDAVLQGECIGGALQQKDLVALLEESGFATASLLKRFPYRVVKAHPFYSLTFAAWKPQESVSVPVVYRGPLAQLELPSGELLLAGHKTFIPGILAEQLGEQVFILDSDDGSVTNLDQGSSCACALPPEEKPPGRAEVVNLKHRSGCMVCGHALIYPELEVDMTCHYCGREGLANAYCEKGHFVCDSCHSEDALAVLEHLCLESRESDLIALLSRLRQHPSIPVNGPEHHALVPGIIVAAYRNSGGQVDEGLIGAAIRRGSQVMGGSCAFVGICGSATGVGIAFSLLLHANPVKGAQRQQVQQVTQQVLASIADYQAPRCCQRDCWLGLKAAAELSRRYLDVTLQADARIGCHQRHQNHECIGLDCPILQEQAALKTSHGPQSA